MSNTNFEETDLIYTPSRRLFLGTVLVGGTAGLTGCGGFESLFGSTEVGKKSSKVVKGKTQSKKRSAQKIAGHRQVQKRKRSVVIKGRHHERALAFHNTHTGERLRATYWADGRYDKGALREIDHLLRDHRSNSVRRIDRKLLDQLFVLRNKLTTTRPVHVISGYRSPKTNALLRKKGGGGVARRSQHMLGKAIDIRVPSRSLNKVRLAALSLQAGGVGYYPGSNFVHLDTGRVRRW